MFSLEMTTQPRSKANKLNFDAQRWKGQNNPWCSTHLRASQKLGIYKQGERCRCNYHIWKGNLQDGSRRNGIANGSSDSNYLYKLLGTANDGCDNFIFPKGGDEEAKTFVVSRENMRMFNQRLGPLIPKQSRYG